VSYHIRSSVKSFIQLFKLGSAITGASSIGQPEVLPVEELESTRGNLVDSYWGEHTVNSKPFRTAQDSEKYLQWRFSVYPKFQEFMQLYGNHDDQVVLDYGCGPGNDLLGFALYTRARKILGIDVSQKALQLASQRLALHHVDRDRIELILSSDSLTTVPLNDGSVDYIHSAGVLHHTSNPQSLLVDFYRVLRPNSYACVMVYNCDSLWLHLYTAYERIIVQGAFQGLTAEAAFAKNTDGVNCPIARCYKAEEFASICNRAGFQCEYLGGYLSDVELKSYQKYAKSALRESRLADEHKKFIAGITFDEEGLPKHNGSHAGIGGVYRLYKK
jgi:ubiquinone/menaquinone biosynthesis C-methylase UbiE